MTTNNAVNTSLSGQTGTGSFVGSTSATLVTPALGTPSSGNLANCTNYPVLDANGNFAANNFNEGFTTTATGATTTTLTVASTGIQFFTGSTTQTVVLPVVSTLVLGQSFKIVNLSTGVVTVESSGTNSILAMGASTMATFTCVLITGTTAASWQVTDYTTTSTANSSILATNSAGSPGFTTTLPTAVQVGVNSLNSGTNASSTTFWSGSGTWVSPLSVALVVNVQVFAASGTYTPTSGMAYCIIECVGGGGGGGGIVNSGATAVNWASGGGSGGYSRIVATAATIGANQTVTCGAGGTAGANSGGTGGTGGNTSVGSICIALGGIGGGTASASGGAGGGTGTGTIALAGNGGGGGGSNVASSANSGTWPGAPSYFGGAGVAIVNTTSAGSNGTTGAGGGGAISKGAGGAAAGGTGGTGYVVITEYCT